MEAIFANLERCIGCGQCALACAVEHSASRDPLRAAFEEPQPKPRIFVVPGPTLNSSMAVFCRHCDPAPCESACPTGAIHRDATYGLMQHTADRCIACAMCAMVCPFDVVTLHPYSNGRPTRIVATKCDGCIQRRRRGEEPACVAACKSGALVMGELNELAAAARQRQSDALLGADSEPASMPDTVGGWRGWGKAATRVAEDASDGKETSR